MEILKNGMRYIIVQSHPVMKNDIICKGSKDYNFSTHVDNISTCEPQKMVCKLKIYIDK